jgi:hypothetical protein
MQEPSFKTNAGPERVRSGYSPARFRPIDARYDQRNALSRMAVIGSAP